MYHTNKINQAFITSFSHKDYHTDNYTPYERKIICLFEQNQWSKLTNKSIADQIGCSIITVIRTTNKLHRNGFITKHRQHKYDINTYTLNVPVKKTHSFNRWLNALPSHDQDMYISHGVIVDHKNKKIVTPRNDTPKSNLILVDSLSRNCMLLSLTARARNTTHKQINIHKKGIVVNAMQKQMILAQRSNPNIKEILNTPTIKSQMITPTIEYIAKAADLNEQEQYKLIAFTEETHEHVLNQVSFASTLGEVCHPNRMEWVIDFAMKYCDENNIKPDWPWYYDVCKMLGRDPKTPRRPLGNSKTITTPHKKHYTPKTYDKTPQKGDDSLTEQLRKLKLQLKHREDNLSLYGGIHGPSTSDKKAIANLRQQIETLQQGDVPAPQMTPVKGKSITYEQIMHLPLDERITKLTSELAIHQQRYECYTGPEYMKGLLGRMIERTTIDLNASVKERDEKQIIQYQNSTYSMAEGSA